MKGIAGAFGSLSSLGQKMREKAEFARTGLYYASESMLVWDHDQKRYDADATPEYGSDTLWDHYANLLSGVTKTDLGAHAVF
jgi:divinyl chlorophyllide a 8-vinyl-reductase